MQSHGREKNMKQETAEMVSYTRETMPALTEQDIAAIKRGGPEPERVIDTSDIPVWTEERWKNAIRGRVPRTAKR
jgi:hypothetical protein